MTFLEKLEALGRYIERESETPRDAALWLCGFAIGIAWRVGWSIDELRALQAWPFGDELSDLFGRCLEFEEEDMVQFLRRRGWRCERAGAPL